GQHEHQSLLDTDAQTALLDSFGRALEARSRVAETWSAWRAAGERLKELENVRERGSREREFMEWQLNELRGAGLRDGEDSDLASERALSRHAVRLTELSQGARDELSGGEGPARALALVRAAAELDPRLGGAGDRLAAVALSKARGAAGTRLARQVAAELGGLRLAGARFEVALEPRTEIGPEGAEQAVMMFSANPGEPLGALARVASGGELARVMLAIK